jgi:DNA-binding beta-propeller fold protein YncE
MRRKSLLSFVVVFGLLMGSFVVAGDRARGTLGDLVQKAGTAGCITEDGTLGACQDGRGLVQSYSVTVSTDSKNAYSTAGGSSALAIFDRDVTTGELTQKAGTAGCISQTGSSGACAVGRGLNGAEDVAVSSDGLFAYVSSYSSAAVAVFDRDPGTGELTQKAGAAGCVAETVAEGCTDGKALQGANSLEISADGKQVYVASHSSSAVAILDRNTTTGELTQALAGTSGCVSDTGTSGTCADGVALSQPEGVFLSPDDKNVYVGAATSSAISIFDRDTTTGFLTQKAGTAGCISESGHAGACTVGRALSGAGQGTSVTTSSDGKNVYMTAQTSDAVSIFDRDTSTGELTQKAGLAGCISETGTGGLCTDGVALDGAMGIAVSQDGSGAYVAASNSGAVGIFDRDGSTGVLTQRAGTAGCISQTGGACVLGKALRSPFGVMISPNAKSVYVATFTSNGVAIFDREALADPTAVDDTATVNEDDPATTIDVLANDQDVTVTTTINSVTQPANGTVVITNSGADLTYEPDADYCNDGDPTDDFTYTLNEESTATVFVTVACSDDTGTAVDDSFTVNENAGVTTIDVLENDTDPEGNPEIDSVTQPTNGAVVLVDGTTVTYQPNPGYCNDGDTFDTFTYTLVGGSTATVNVTVTCTPLIQPDVKVKLFSDVTYVGDDVYSAHGKDQIRRMPVKRGKKMTYDFEIQNDGSSADTFMLRGNDNNVGYSVKFYDNEDADITKAIFKGTYSTGSLDPQESIVIHAVLRLFPDVNLNNVKSIKVTAKSGLDPAIVDRAIGQAKPK